MAAELKQSALEFRWVSGDEAREIDPQKLDWPSDAHILFVFEDGEVVARSSMSTLPILMMPMIEGSWIKDENRNGMLAYRLMKEVEKHFVEYGKTHAFAFNWTEQPEVGGYMERLGYVKQPLTVYMKQLVKE